MRTKTIIIKQDIPKYLKAKKLGYHYLWCGNGRIVLKKQFSITEKRAQRMYLDFVNNFLSVECFASHYDLTLNHAKSFLQEYQAKVGAHV